MSGFIESSRGVNPSKREELPVTRRPGTVKFLIATSTPLLESCE